MRNCKTGLEDWLFSGSDARAQSRQFQAGAWTRPPHEHAMSARGCCMLQPDESCRRFQKAVFVHLQPFCRANFTVKRFEVEQNRPLAFVCLTHWYQVKAKLMPGDMFGHGVCAQVSTSAASAANSWGATTWLTTIQSHKFVASLYQSFLWEYIFR